MISIVIPRELQPRGASLSEKKSRKVLITRPQPAAGEFAHRLEKDGFTCFVAPMTAYVEQDPGIADLSDYQAVIFTSAQTVQLFSKFFKDRYIPVFAVGDATAKAAEGENFRRVYSAKGDGQALVKLMRDHKGELKLRRALHACGEDTAENLSDQLQDDGIYVDRAPFYKADFVEELPNDVVAALKNGDITTVTFLSARTASNFVRLVQAHEELEGMTADLEAVCISDRVATEARGLPWRAVRVASRPQLEACIDLLNEQEKDIFNFRPMSAEAVIAAFGGLRPLATKLNIPASTVQGWRQRGSIPEARFVDILLAAHAEGIDPETLWGDGGEEGEASGSGDSGSRGGRAAQPANESDRRRGGDRRRRHVSPDDKGIVRGDGYTGPDRRGGVDRRAFELRQLNRINSEKKRFVNRTVVMTAFFLIAALYAGMFLMTPEFFEIKKKAGEVEAMQARVDDLNRRILEIQNAQKTQKSREASFGQKLNQRLGDVEQIAKNLSQATSNMTKPVSDVVNKVADSAVAAANTTAAGKNISSFLQLLGNMDALGKTEAGKASVDRALATLRHVLAVAPTDTDALNGAVGAARKSDKDVALLLGNVNAKDLGAAALLLAFNELRGDLGSKRSFNEDLLIMEKFIGDDPEMKKSLARLKPYAESGVLSRRQLQKEFEGLASDIVMARLQGKDLSVQDEIMKRLSTLVKVRKVDDVTGTSEDAVVARAQILLNKGDVKGAIRELQSLEGAPAQAAAPFIEQAAGNVMAEDASAQMLQKIMEMFQGGGMGAGDVNVDQLLQDAWSGGPLGILPYLTGDVPEGGTSGGLGGMSLQDLLGGLGGGGGEVPIISPGMYQGGNAGGDYSQ